MLEFDRQGKRNEIFVAIKRKLRSVVDTCQNNMNTRQMQPNIHIQCPIRVRLAHVGKLLVNSVVEEDLPLARELYLQPLLCERNELLLGQAVEIGLAQTLLHNLDDGGVVGAVHHVLEVHCATWSRLVEAEGAASADRRR